MAKGLLFAAFYILTALALRPAATAGRVALIAAGVTGFVVAVSPEPANGEFSGRHAIAAGFGFALLAVWPLLASRPGPGIPWGLRPKAALGIFFAFLCFLAWFVVELTTGGGDLGLAERALGVVQVFWPVTVVLSCQPFHPVTVVGEPVTEAEAALGPTDHPARFAR